MTTKSIIQAKFTIPEMHENKKITWNMDVAKNLGSYDMIIGRDLLKFLGVDLLFSQEVIAWNNAAIPFKNVSRISPRLFYIKESTAVTAATNRVKEILNAKYKPADLE